MMMALQATLRKYLQRLDSTPELQESNMNTVAHPTKTYELAAKNAILYASDTDYVGQTGVALRQRDGRVFFQADHAGIWTDITDVEPGQIQLCGDVALD